MRIINGDCLDVLKELEDNSVDSIVTDPPYGLSFMGKRWDYDVPNVDIWKECLRVLKPGGHLLCFAGTRTQHRMAVRIEDAGFEIRDMIAWVYGSGFPKSLDVSKAIDKAAGAEREVVGIQKRTGKDIGTYGAMAGNNTITTPATPEAKQWQGWGTALKPAFEPITVARKPLIGTVAENVLQHGTGAINVEGCRVGREERTTNWSSTANYKLSDPKIGTTTAIGRWPANFIHDGSEEVVALFPWTKNGGKKNVMRTSKATKDCNSVCYGNYGQITRPEIYGGDSGLAARFFYCAKASKRDRDEGCEGMEQKSAAECVDRVEGSAGMNSPRAGAGRTSGSHNHHPTVKPTDLMRYLCRLVTPPDGTVLDPFMGSGSTGKAAVLEGFRFIGIEREEEYCEIAERRIEAVVNNFW